MNRVWRAVLLLAALCAALGAMTASAGAKPTEKPAKAGKPGALDTTFGTGGKVSEEFPAENAGTTGPKYELPFEFTPGHLQMAQAPGGKVVVAGAQKIVRYLANGKLDPSFGQGGVVTVPRRCSCSPASPSTPTGGWSSPASPDRCRATRPRTRC
jgi:hypothetical protein